MEQSPEPTLGQQPLTWSQVLQQQAHGCQAPAPPGYPVFWVAGCSLYPSRLSDPAILPISRQSWLAVLAGNLAFLLTAGCLFPRTPWWAGLLTGLLVAFVVYWLVYASLAESR